MLNINPHQQAMLKAMGIDLPWQQATAPAEKTSHAASEHSGQAVAASIPPAAPAQRQQQPKPVSASATPATTASRPPASLHPKPEHPSAVTPLSDAERQSRESIAQMSWDELTQAVSQCTACQLCKTRTQAVFGVGQPQAQWMIVGEAPGENEDKQGEPFVGQAGKLLDRMLMYLNLARRPEKDQLPVYIANVLKCRPPRNRNPEPAEMAQCAPYLQRQIELIQPKLIMATGRFAVQTLLGSHEAIGRLRGQVHHYKNIPVIVTYHPAYLLRNPVDKRKAWADLCLAADTFDKAQP